MQNRRTISTGVLLLCLCMGQGARADAQTCAITTDVVEDYAGPFNDVVETRREAVVVFRTRQSPYSYRCSGTLIAPDLILTAQHCEDLEDLDAVFGLEREGQAIVVRAAYPVTAIVETGALSSGVRYDYKIVRIGTNVAQVLGITPTPVRAYLPRVGAPAVMIGHPMTDGEPTGARVMQAASGAFTVVPTAPYVGVPLIRASVSSRTGASGSGLLDENGALVGVLTNAENVFATPPDCTLGFGAVPVSTLVRVSPILRALARSVEVGFAGRRVNDAQIHATCGSAPEQSCYRRVSNYLSMLDTTCTISCPPGAQVAVFCDIMRPSRGAGITVSEIYVNRTSVQVPGQSYTTASTYHGCAGMSCSVATTVSAPMSVTCRLDD